MSEVYILDTETSGRGDDREVVEAAWLAIRPVHELLGANADAIAEPLSITESFCRRYKPSKPMAFGAIAVHHILPEELEGCDPSSSFALPAGAKYIAGHSIDFDWEAIGRPDVKRICTYAMAQHVWPEADGYSQSALLYMLNGATVNQRRLLKGAHGALVDVENNMALLEHILLAKPDIRLWSALWAFSEECRVPLYCPLKRWDGLKLSEMDDGAVSWCLRQDWIDNYFRLGLERVLAERYPPQPPLAHNGRIISDTVAVADTETVDDDDIPF